MVCVLNSTTTFVVEKIIFPKAKCFENRLEQTFRESDLWLTHDFDLKFHTDDVKRRTALKNFLLK